MWACVSLAEWQSPCVGILKQFKYALVWGTSVKHRPQKVGKEHVLQDEDIVQARPEPLKPKFPTVAMGLVSILVMGTRVFPSSHQRPHATGNALACSSNQQGQDRFLPIPCRSAYGSSQWCLSMQPQHAISI